MRVTRKELDDAKTKIEKAKAKIAEASAVVEMWNEAEKEEPARDGEEVVAYEIDVDGTVTKSVRSKVAPETAAA